MKLVTKVETFDGSTHVSQDAAMRHLDRLYGTAICNLCSRMITETEGKYTKLQNFIDNNLAEFKVLMDIKHDMTLEKPSDDD